MAHDIRFVEDDWESPTLGAWGLGWEVWLDGMEVSQFTYFQQVGGIECDPVSTELTYGLERLAMYVQGVENVYDLDWNGRPRDQGGMTYGDVYLQAEREFSAFNFEHATTEKLLRHFVDAEEECGKLLGLGDERRQPRAAGAAGLRPVHEGEPRLQSAGRARRHLRDRAPGLYRPRARARQGLLRGLAGEPAGPRLTMAELFLELFSEEIPARMQARASEDLKRLVTEKLKEAGLAFTSANAYATPRRLALTVDGLPLSQPDVTEEKRGPRVGAPEQAIQGFLKSAGLASLDQCEKRDTGKGEFWFAVVKKKGVKTAALLPALLTASFAALPWPKSMRWAGHHYRWVRPLHSIVATFDGHAIEGAIDLGGSVHRVRVRPRTAIASSIRARSRSPVSATTR